MAYPTTNAGWLTYIKDYLDVGDYADATVQSFLDEATIMLNRELNSFWMEKETTYTIAGGFTTIDLMAAVPDFNRIRLVGIQGKYPLDSMTLNEIKTLIADIAAGQVDSGSGPTNYCITAQRVYLQPMPSLADVVEISYYAQVPALGGGTDSNVFSLRHPDLFTIACAKAAAPYMAEDERVPGWESSYNSKVQSINDHATDARIGSTPLKRVVKALKRTY